MTEMQELLENLLTNRINEEIVKSNKDFTEILNVMNIFLADNSITTAQYASLTKLIVLSNTNTTTNNQSN